ncbi:pilus assembly protein TadG-related protein [Ensifer soli]|uniref:pilus assembly protein TadG-related protein n=1 Tax=Ciceribacter sp. sgz301302 TaxID=3342379 RepID=UPI0035B9AC37
MRRRFKSLFLDRSGNFGMLAAISMVPMIGIAGLSIDFTRALQTRAEVQESADAAALAVLAEGSVGMLQALAMSGNGEVPLAEEDAKAFFRAAARANGQAPEDTNGSAELALSNLSVSAVVTKSGRDLKSVIHYEMTIPTSLLRVIGKDSLTVSGTATAVYQTNAFMDFYMLLDNTPSMGLGATTSDINLMVQNTPDACAFACHIVSEAGVDNANSYYHLAKRIGAKIRIDVVAQATAALMDEAIRQQKYVQQFRVGAFTFGKNAQNVTLQTISPLTDNLRDVKQKATEIGLMSIPYQNYDNDQQTSFDKAFSQVNSVIDTPGTGDSITDRQKIVFFVSDGVGDSSKASNCTKRLAGATRCQEPIDVRACQALKARGIKIAVLYTTYLPLPTNSWYNSWIRPFQSEIATNMEACASDGLFFEVTPSQGIAEAMRALFIKTIKSPRLAS